MSPHDLDCERLGREAAALRDQELVPAMVAHADLASALEARPRNPWKLVAAGAAAACLAGVLALVFLRPTSQALRLGDGTGLVGAWVQSGPSGLPLDFADGSRVGLAPNARARVEELRPNGARVRVEGSASLQVRHRRDTSWAVLAGPYEVAVTGTAFTVAWDVASEALDVRVTEGAIRVSGPGLDPARAVLAGDRLTLPATQAVPPPAIAPVTPVEPTPPPAPEPPTARPTLRPGPIERARPAPVPALPTEPAPAPKKGWQELAREGRFGEAWTLLEEAGFPRELDSARSGDEVVALAEVARLARRSDEARLAYRSARQRFPATPAAARAAFALGVLSFPAHDSTQYFDLYLAEAPDGDFAAEAMGRLVEAYRAAGDLAAARAAARAYLARFPSGPHAELARGVLP